MTDPAGTYSRKVLDLFRDPHNMRRLAQPTASREAYNPLCGDRLRVELRVEDGVIQEAAFSGDGCAISVAAASLLTDAIIGMKVADVEGISAAELAASLECELDPIRRGCAELALGALREICG